MQIDLLRIVFVLNCFKCCATGKIIDNGRFFAYSQLCKDLLCTLPSKPGLHLA